MSTNESAGLEVVETQPEDDGPPPVVPLGCDLWMDATIGIEFRVYWAPNDDATERSVRKVKCSATAKVAAKTPNGTVQRTITVPFDLELPADHGITIEQDDYFTLLGVMARAQGTVHCQRAAQEMGARLQQSMALQQMAQSVRKPGGLIGRDGRPLL